MAIKNFSQYLVEEDKEVYFTFGRMNPPTTGHGKVMDNLQKKSGKYDYKVYMSQKTGAKDPLSYKDKVKHIRKMYPKHARSVIMDPKVKNVFDVASQLYDQGYTKICMVVGQDRLREFTVLLEKYNGKKARHGFYNFQSIKVVSAGQRDPDAEGVEGMSASKQRAFAKDNDYQSFTQGVPRGYSDKDTRKLFNDVRKGMGLKEELHFKNHIALPVVSETREQYIQGELYAVGDEVIIKESDELVKVAVLGTNYVIVERTDGTRLRKWLDAVELVERQDSDIKDRKGTQPARYHKGLEKSTKVKRDAHFKKHGKKDDDDESAYKPAPGDKTAKTKPSKYTKAFKDMYDEDCWDGYKQVGMKKKGNKTVPDCVPVSEYGGPKISRADYLKKGREYHSVKEDVSQKQLSDLEKFADRLLAKFKVDIEFTRHFADRMNDDRNKPAITVAELQRVFKKIAKNKAKNIRQNPDSEAVIKDLQMDLNLPVVIKYDRNKDEFEVVNKTIMRKKNFKSSSKTITTEGRMLGKLKSLTINKKEYQHALKTLKDLIARKKKENGGKLRHGTQYYAQKIAKTYSGMDDRALHSLLGEDAVATAQDKISREKEADKKKHDRILDRARLARARTKNRETK